MQHDHPPIQAALMVLGQSVNPVKVVGPAQIGELYARMTGANRYPSGLNAFRSLDDSADPHIYVNRDSAVYGRRPKSPQVSHS